MIDQESVERAAQRFKAPDGALERLISRRDRKRRNQRIAAGVVGIAVFVAAVLIVTSVSSLDRSETSVVPGGDVTGPAETAAVDDGFRGRYQVIGREVGGCPWGEDFSDRVMVRYVDEGVRKITHAGLVYNGRLRYTRGERLPWQSHQYGRSWKLRYDPATDRAVGTRDGLETCLWRVRFVSIG